MVASTYFCFQNPSTKIINFLLLYFLFVWGFVVLLGINSQGSGEWKRRQ